VLRPYSYRTLFWALPLVLCASTTRAQSAPESATTPVSVSADMVFYGDNNEFFSMFRTGETVLGSWLRARLDLALSPHAALTLGVYALGRDGCDSFAQDHAASSPCHFELARPVASLALGTRRHRVILGTLQTGGQPEGMGPDRTTPHGLLPALAVEQLWLDHGYEAGAQWLEDSRHWRQDLWFDYRRAVSDQHHEFFNAGSVGHLQPSPTAPVALAYQFQIVHHGGQDAETGPISDSFAGGPGLVLRHPFPTIGLASLETYALFSDDRPDRTHDELTMRGHALLVRLAAENNGWRAHVIGWEGHDFKHEDGDPNYQSYVPDLHQNFLGTRNYYELGLARVMHPGKTIDFEVSGRAHYTQDRWGYSYRLVGIVHFGVWQR
jgi:hypothetical protein